VDSDLVRKLLKDRNWTNRELAARLGISEDKVSKSLATNGKARRWQGAEVMKLMELLSEDEPLVKTEVRGTGLTPAQIRDALSAPGNVKPVPLLGTALGGGWGDAEIEMTELRLGEILDRVSRPQSLLGDDAAYALEIVGDSMAPRFEPGERVFVSPKANVRPGDDVIVQLVDPRAELDLADAVTEVLIKRFVRRTAAFVELRQFNPDQTFQVPLNRIAKQGGRLAIHRVMGRL
jgi:phage repressor protein C with HTH and peptisase S24 domain